MKTLAEEMVTTLQQLRQERDDIDSWMRKLRLGDRLGTQESVRVKTLLWLKTNQYQAKPIPGGMASEFYSFLGDKLTRLGDEIRRVEAQLDALTKPGDQDG